MKKNLLLIVAAFSAVVFASCGGQSSSNAKNQPVELGFADFILGDSFADCVALADKDSSMKRASIKKEDVYDYAVYQTTVPFFTDGNTPISQIDSSIPAAVEVSAYSGRIFKIELFSTVYAAKSSFPAMYKAKYGEGVSEGARDNWNFNNAKITVWVKSHTNERKELDPSRAHLKLHNVENYYRTVYDYVYDGTSVIYLDKTIDTEVTAFEKRKKEVKDSLAQAKKAEEDAAKNKAQEEQEKAVKESQKEIVNNLRY